MQLGHPASPENVARRATVDSGGLHASVRELEDAIGNSTSGTARVQRAGTWSNPVTFNINTATISNVAPASGVPGTQVTTAGSGFGAAQGSGQVWLGAANGVVESWSDTQVVALVAPLAGSASTSGKAQILQNGVWSNAIPFTVNSLQIANVDPLTGGPGTSVTFTGAGFGTDAVWLGSTSGQVITWSDTQVVAAVAPSAVTGIAGGGGETPNE